MLRPHRRSACHLIVLVAIAGAGAGCSSSCGSKSDDSKTKPGEGTTSSKASPPAKSATERAFDALVAQVMHCPWQPPRGVLGRCVGLEKFHRSELSLNETLLVGLLDDPNERKRWLGATGLRRGHSYRTDAAMAQKLVAAMERERSVAPALAMADAISRIHLKQTKLADRVEALLRNHPVVVARARLIQYTLFYNRDTLYDMVAKLATTATNPVIRSAAIAALFTGTPTARQTDSCTLWRGLVDDPNAKLGAMGAAFATRYRRGVCKRDYDAVLDVVAKRARAGTVKAEQLTDALRNIQLQPGATKKQKQRAVAVARVLLTNTKNYGPSRARALELLNRVAPDGAALVKRYLKDKDGFVMRRAERLDRMRAKRRAVQRPKPTPPKAKP